MGDRGYRVREGNVFLCLLCCFQVASMRILLFLLLAFSLLSIQIVSSDTPRCINSRPPNGGVIPPGQPVPWWFLFKEGLVGKTNKQQQDPQTGADYYYYEPGQQLDHVRLILLFVPLDLLFHFFLFIFSPFFPSILL